MGIEHPYLAILAIIAFTMAIMSIMYFFIHTYTEMLKTPLLSTTSEACYSENTVYLTITLKHERGLPVVLQRVEVYSDKGLVVYTPGLNSTSIQVELKGFSGKLGPGQVGFIKMTFPQGYFTVGREYSGLVFFDIGNTVFTFQLVECPQITPTPALKAKLVDMNTTAKNGTVTAISTLRIVKIERSLESQENVIYYDTFDTDPFEAGRMVNLTCNWGWNSTEKAVYIDFQGERPQEYGGECIAQAVNIPLIGNGTVYVATILKFIGGRDMRI